MSTDVQAVEGQVSRVVFSNEETGYAVVRLEPDGRAAITVAGSLGGVAEEDRIRAFGSFEEHGKFGRQFRAVSVERLNPTTLKGMERYLGGPRVKGIGPEFARRIVAAFGHDTFRVLDEEPQRLREVEGIGRKRAGQIAEDWHRENGRRELLVFLQGHGLGPGLAARVETVLGEDALARVQTNPYVMVEKVSGVGFRTADRIARSMGIEVTAGRRLRAGLLHVLDEALLEGSLCLPGELLLEQGAALLEVEQDLLRRVLRQLVDRGETVIARPALRMGDQSGGYMVYKAFAFMAETEAARRILLHLEDDDGRLAVSCGPDDPELAELSDEQRDAVMTLLGARIAVLTGGPGVGKTTVLRSLVAIWRRAGLRVALACPTGRAAKRLEEVTGAAAATIHRLLRFDGKKRAFSHDADHPLEADVLVIDEVSMLDLPLFLHLLRALPRGCRLLLVGDADQLPSVGPGSVLGDLIGSAAVPVARLTRVFRQATRSGIVPLAHAILQGEIPDLPRDRGADLFFVETDDPESGAEVIRELVLRELPRRAGISGPQDIQVLAPMHRGPAGTRELNRVVAEALGADRPALSFGDEVFRRGDRIMQVRNDYDRELFNGDMGWVVDLQAEEEVLIADFDGRRHEFKKRQLGDLQPAWAISVHKSQGGEYPAVVLPIFGQHWMMLQRQVLYTAVTRARRVLVIVGSRRALARAIGNVETARRFGHLADWLRREDAEIWQSRA